MVWDPKQRKVVGLAGSGRSPRALSLETVRSRAQNGQLPPLGAVTVSAPGALDGWWTLHQRYGKLKWAELFAPAIGYAERGAPVPGDHRLLHPRQPARPSSAPAPGSRRPPMSFDLWGKGPADRRDRSAIPTSPAPTG